MMAMGMQIQYSSSSSVVCQCHWRPRNFISSFSFLPKHNHQYSFNNHHLFSRSSSSSLSAKRSTRPLPPFTSIHKLPAASGNSLISSPDSDKTSPPPSLSDILWPSLGGFAAMAMLGKIDQILAPKGMAMTIPPLGAVCAVLFVTPNAPAARKYNMFTAQIGCAALGVLAFTIFGPGWLARSAALAAALAFMIYTKSMHPPAASLPLMFIDGAKLHGLNYWYALFPGAAGCIVLSLIQEVVYYLKENFKF